jgi:hypothetical protein
MSQETKITVNGREYDSVEHMPPDVREIYLQAIAAMGQAESGDAPGMIKKDIVSRVVQESITYNGREYKSRDELPPEVRKLLDNMPALSADNPRSEVKIVTDRTIIPETRSAAPWGLSDDRPERDPKVAWLLVMMLSIVVLILLFLLYLSGLRHK